MEDHDTGFHDHDLSGGAVGVVAGAVREDRLALGGGTVSRVAAAGDTFTFSAADIHRVLHAGDAPAVTIHAYSPPLWRMGAYEIGGPASSAATPSPTPRSCARFPRSPEAEHPSSLTGGWPSSATSSPGTRCSPRAARTSGWSCRPRRTGGPRARSRSRRSCTRRSPTRCWRAASIGCGPTRPRRCTPPGPARRSSPPAPRAASRSASSSRRSTRSAATRAPARSTCTRPRRSRRTRRARCTRSASSARGRRSTTATRRASSAPRSAGART